MLRLNIVIKRETSFISNDLLDVLQCVVYQIISFWLMSGELRCQMSQVICQAVMNRVPSIISRPISLSYLFISRMIELKAK